MVKNIIGIPGRVAGQAGGTFINIAPYPIVLVVGFRIGVAIGTGYLSIVVKVGMAIHALSPFTGMGTTVNGEKLCIVVKG